ncbi:MAG: glycoside hydrolase family 18 protein [Clostridia bacterium]|nr:glycoside hydrolase family 18 protein [Clostridia bacterium]
MQIHVVKPGETIWGISNIYSVYPDRIISANQLENTDNLVVGQNLVIPIQGRYHFVQPGENLTTISNLYGIPVDDLIAINGIYNPNLVMPGLRLYIPQGFRPEIETAAFVDLAISRERAAEDIAEVGPYLTYLNIFSYTMNPDGTLNPPDDTAALNAAQYNRNLPLMVITNFKDGTFDQDIATAVLSDEAAQDVLINEILTTMQEKGYVGVNFDLEYLGRENRENYVNFLQRTVDVLRPQGYEVSVALAPKLSEEQLGTLYEGHNYQAIGEVVDYVMIMTYEWGWSGGPPLAVSPIDEVKRVLDFAVSVIPPEKILMGAPLYGYDWKLPYERGGQWAKTLDPQEAIALAAQYGATINYDPESQAPYFNYYDEDGIYHVVWFEDARSIQAKFDVVKDYGLRGIFYWVLGNKFPQNWLLLSDNFRISKQDRTV